MKKLAALFLFALALSSIAQQKVDDITVTFTNPGAESEITIFGSSGQLANRRVSNSSPQVFPNITGAQSVLIEWLDDGSCFDRIHNTYTLFLGCRTNNYVLNACASVRIETDPVLGNVTPNQDVCYAGSGPVPVVRASPGYGLLYRWEYWTAGSDWVPVSGERSPTLAMDMSLFPQVEFNENVNFRYRLSNCGPNDWHQMANSIQFQMQPPVINQLSSTPPNCLGASNGRILLDQISRTPNTTEGEIFDYHIYNTNPSITDNGDGTYNITPSSIASFESTSTSNTVLSGIGLPAGTYYVLVIPIAYINGTPTGVGCGEPMPRQVTIAPGSRPDITSVTENDPVCSGNGSLVVNTSNIQGTANYQLRQGSTTIRNWQTSRTFTNVPPGNYTVRLRDNRSGTNCFAVDEPASIATASAPVITSVTENDPVCSGNGSLTVNRSNTTGTVRYQLQQGSTVIRSWQSSNLFSNVPPGSYTVRLRDTRGSTNCFATDASASIAFASLPQINTPAITNPPCAGGNGSIDVNASGITGTPSYRLMQGSTVIRNWQSGDVFSNVSPGNYTVRLRDNRGGTNCNATDQGVTIATASSIQITSAPAVNPVCPGGTGQITVNATGITGTANYRLMQGATVIRNWQASNVFTIVNSGSYTVRLRDNRGGTNCFASDFPAAVATPSTPQISSTPVIDPICAGDPGTITVNSINTTGTVNYRLMQGSTVIRNWQSSNVFNNVPSGGYTVRLRDNRGGTNCFATNASATVSAAAAVTITNVSSTQPVCAGESTGTVTVTATGILGTASYRLEGSVNYGWQSSNFFPAVQAEIYTVRVRDNRSGTNCFAVNGNITVTDPPAVVASLGTQINPNCHNEPGTITLAISDGTGPYSYRLGNSGGASLNGLVNSLTDVTPTFTFPTTIPTYLANFQIHVTDFNGCTDNTPNIIFTNPTQVGGNITISSPIICNGGTGSLQANPTGGSGTYTYLWNDPSAQETQTATGLSQGMYSVLITDGEGCTTNPSLTINQPSAFNTSYTTSDVTCFGASDGSINVTVSGATPGYTYSWNDGNPNQDRTNLGPGTYSVTITDNTGICNTVISGIVISELPQVTASANVTDISCNGGTGSVTLVPGGGSGNYEYSLNGSTWVSGSAFSGLGDGNYTGYVRDMNEISCMATDDFSITEPALLVGNFTETIPVDCNGGTGSLRANPSGGTSPYTYLWSDGQITRTASGLTAGNYDVVITDVNGCNTNPSYVFGEPDAFSTSHSLNDVTCFGDSDGIIDVTISGATSPYTYLWNDGNTNQDRSDLGPGNYSVTITDLNNCVTNINGIVISEPAALILSATGTDPLCSSETGSVVLNGSGGEGTLNYSLDGVNYQSNSNFIGLSDGNYTGYVRDVNMCVTTEPFSIIVPDALALSETVTNATCNGFNGGIMATVTGGTSPYTFEWRNNLGAPVSSNEDLNNVSAGQYTLYITDINGCTDNFSVSVLDEVLDVQISGLQGVSCDGGLDGTATIVANDGALPLTILWDNGETTLTASTLDAGFHTVDITDLNGCSDQLSVTIPSPDPLVLSLESLSDPLCNGSTDGSVEVSAAGGTGGLNFSWSNGQTGNTLSNVGAGNYQVTVTDVNGCTVNADFTLTENSPVGASHSTSDHNGYEITCFGADDGSIALAGVTGGTGTYTYLWSTGATTSSISSLLPGTYSVTITDSNGCDFVINNIAIDQPDALVGSFGSIVDVACSAESTGSVTLAGTGGATPYEFSLDGANWQSGQVFGTLTAGSYTGHIRDANNCSTTTNFSILEPLTLSATSVVNDATCGQDNGDATITPAGGVAPYNYSWDFEGSEVSTTVSINNAAIGNYEVTITDANSCTLVQFVTVSNQEGAIVTVQSSEQPTCFDASDGSATISLSGGITPYDIVWSTGETTLTAFNLEVGNNSVTVTDGNGCVSIEQVSFIDPQPISISNSVIQDPLCPGNSNGSIQITSEGGTGTLTALWSDGQTGLIAENLSEGNYSVDITDANGCVFTDNFTLTDPASLQASNTVSDFSGFGTTCSDSTDGSIDLTVTGGTGPYTFSWSNSETTEDIQDLTTGFYSVTIQDTNGCTLEVNNIEITSPNQVQGEAVSLTDALCMGSVDGTVVVMVTTGFAPYQYSLDNGNNNQSSPVFNNLSAGDYQILATDTRGCTTTIDFTIGEPNQITLTPTIENATCSQSNGSINITTSGGTGPYLYSWKNLSGTEVSQLESLENVSSGRYSIEVMDENGCVLLEEHTILNERLDFDITSSSEPLCHDSSDGTATVTINEGIAPFDILWSSGETELNASELVLGLNTVTITDANGCVQLKSVEFTGPTPIQISLSSLTVPTCFGGSDASIDISVSGGTGSYAYSWNNGVSTQDLSDLSSGEYNVTVTDENNCELSGTFTINDINPITVSSVITSPTCEGDSDAGITLSVSGGNGGYSYLWNIGATTKDISGVFAGTYTVTITDQLGCEQQESVIIDDILPVTINPTVSEQLCAEDALPSIQLDVSGGNGGYSYLWNTGAQTKDLFNLNPGMYDVTVTDSKGCEAQQNFMIPTVEPISINETITPPQCQGESNATIDLSVFGGTGVYSYSWTTGSTTKDITGIAAGSYTVTVTDSNGCDLEKTVTVNDINPIVASSAVTLPTCHGDDDAAISLTVSGGNGSYDYLWNTGGTTKDLNALTAGTYEVTITDANGCLLTEQITVNEKEDITIAETITRPSCPGDENGSIMLAVSGGNGGYSFSWNTGTQTSGLFNLSAGIYEVTVVDQNGCQSTKNIEVTDFNPISVTADIHTPVCFEESTASIDLSVAGGNGSYSYNWSNGTSSQNLTGVRSGEYSVTVTDQNGCSALEVFSIQELEPLSIQKEIVHPVCIDERNGSIALNLNGGNGGYTYLWNNGEVTPSLSNLSAGSYDVVVADANGCTIAETFVILNPADLTMELDDIAICESQIFSMTAPVDAAIYTWSGPAGFSESTRTVDISVPGEYTLDVEGENGCMESASFSVVIDNSALNADFLMATEAFVGDTIVMIDISWPIPEGITWSIPSEAQIVFQSDDWVEMVFSEPGEYAMSIEVMLAGCIASYSQAITIHSKEDSENGRQIFGVREPHIKDLSIHPNPSEGIVNLKLELREESTVDLSVINARGNSIPLITKLSGDSSYKLTLDLTDYGTGVFFLRADSGGSSKTIRIFIK